MATSTESPKEQMGEIENEKEFHSPQLGTFIFRLPYIMDELAVLRRRVQLMGIAEELAGQEMIAIAHARAMIEIYTVRAPHNFNFDKLRDWTPVLDLAGQLNTWHQDFFRSMAPAEREASPTPS